MGTFSDDPGRAQAEATSPDGTVTVGLRDDGDITVRLADGCLSRHTEDSLGRQVGAAVRLVIAVRARNIEGSLRELTGPDEVHP